MNEAPEGSEERAAARAFLLRSLKIALEDGMSAAEWKQLMIERTPETVAAVGPDDLQNIVRFCLGKQRHR